MCLQCITKAVSYGEALPGFQLMRATQDAWNQEPKEWEKGQLGLVVINDPTFVLTVEPEKDPLAGLTDEEIDALDLDDPRFESEGYSKAAGQIDADLCASDSPRDIYRLVVAATKVGYDAERDGGFGWWLSDHLARYLETHSVVPDAVPEEVAAEEKTLA